MTTTFTLPAVGVDVLAQVMGVDCARFPLAVPRVGDDRAHRLRIADVALAELTRRGAVDGAGIVRDVDHALRLLATAPVAVALRGWSESPSAGHAAVGHGVGGTRHGAQDDTLLARASIDGGDGLVVEQHGPMLRFELLSAGWAVRRLVEIPPGRPPATGPSLVLSGAADLDGGAGGRERADLQWREAENRLARRRTGAGHLLVLATCAGDDVPVGSVTWLDTDDGRYAGIVRPGSPDAAFFPAHPQTLRQLVDDLVASASAV